MADGARSAQSNFRGIWKTTRSFSHRRRDAFQQKAEKRTCKSKPVLFGVSVRRSE